MSEETVSNPKVQGVAASDDAESGNPVQIGGSVDETSPASGDEGDVRRIRVSPEGNVYTCLLYTSDAADE